VYEHVAGMGVRLLHSCVYAFAAEHLTSLVLCLCVDRGVGLGGGLSPRGELETTGRLRVPGRDPEGVCFETCVCGLHACLCVDVCVRSDNSCVWMSRGVGLGGRSKTSQGQDAR
jgi:hypothetical protein